MMQSLRTFLSSIHYCLKLSCENLRLYTVLRMVGKVITPLLRIATTYLVAPHEPTDRSGQCRSRLNHAVSAVGTIFALTAATVLIKGYQVFGG
jgi:hypothetical protein